MIVSRRAKGAAMSRRGVLWVLGGVAAVAVAVLVVLLVWYAPADEEVAPDDVVASPATSSEEPSEEPSVEPADDPPEPPAEPPADDGPADPGAPLRDPGDHLPADGSSDIPAAGSELVEGDYFAHLYDVDGTARTIDVDVEVFYFGDAAIDYLAAHEPDEENPPPNDYWIANDSTALRTLPLADDVQVWDWCFTTSGGELGFTERTVAEWAAAPAGGGDMASDSGTALSRGYNEVYWLQVRGGEVRRVIGQYLP